LFCVGDFQDKVSPAICPSWLQTTILISASWVAWMTGMSHWAWPKTFYSLVNLIHSSNF
jgi:hypothetical protein